MVPTRTNAVRGAWEPPFAFAEGDATAISSLRGAKRLVHSSGCVVGRPAPGGGGGPRRGLRGVRAEGEVPRQRHAEGTRRHDDRNPQYRKCTGFRIHSPKDRI